MHGPSFIEQIYITAVTYGCIDTVDQEKIKYVIFRHIAFT